MEISDDKLIDQAGNAHYSPANYIGPEITPRYIIMHCTATASSFERNAAAMASPQYKGAVHLLVGRAGEFQQFIPFNRAGGHCGQNHWHDVYHNMDRHSIGIELLNGGPLRSNEQGEYYKSSGGNTYVIPPEDRILLGGKWWQIYPQAQLDTAHAAVKALIQNYPQIKDILGHNEINPEWRPDDPGLAFPMQWFHASLLGLDETLAITRVQALSSYTHLYSGPGMGYEYLGEGYPKNTPVGVLAEQDGWLFVQLNPDSANPPFITGWLPQNRVKPETTKPRHYHRPAGLV